MTKSTATHRNPSKTNRFKALLRGNGAIAQAAQRAIAIATRGIYVGGSNSGIVNTGLQFVVNIYVQNGGALHNKRRLAEHVQAYLAWLVRYSADVTLFPTQPAAENISDLRQSKVKLDNVVVPLMLHGLHDSTQIKSNKMLALAPKHNLLLLAEAGQGKSFALFTLARLLAQHLWLNKGWDDADALKRDLGFDSLRDLAIPFYLPLNEYAAQSGQNLVSFLNQRLKEQAATQPDFPDDFLSVLLAHNAPVVLLLDGLDEIVDDAAREAVSEQLRTLSAGQSQLRLVVASRVLAYRGASQLGDDFRLMTLADFDRETMERLIRQMFVSLRQDSNNYDDAIKTRKLLDGIANLEQQRAAAGEPGRLIDSPLMTRLAVTVSEFTQRPLPSRRAHFLALAIEAMLRANYALTRAEQALIEGLVGGWENHRKALADVAFELHQHNARRIGAQALQTYLQQTGLAPAHANELLAYARSRGGVFREYANGEFGFVHLALQQALVAFYLAHNSAGDANNMAGFLVAHSRITSAWWREVAHLLPGLLDEATVSAYVDALTDPMRDPRLSTPVRAACTEVALQTARDYLEPNHPCCARLAQAFATVLEDGATMDDLPLPTRLSMGQWLEQHGDPRSHVLDVDAMHLCWVPRGKFWMGDDDSEFADEKPAGWCDVPYDYWIGQYPITNAQFNQFVQDKGYANPRWWGIAQAAGAWANGQVMRREFSANLPPELRTRVLALRQQERNAEADNLILTEGKKYLKPIEVRSAGPDSISVHNNEMGFVERIRRFPNHPAAGINWYEALAFCEWMTDRLGRNSKLPNGWRVTLPNEPEWEKAARGGITYAAQGCVTSVQQMVQQVDSPQLDLQPNPLSERQFPWGDLSSEQACNVAETGVHFTSPVGCFTSSQHPYGCQEMSGNVAEWTRSLYGPYDLEAKKTELDFKYPYSDRVEERENLAASKDITRVLRGGSFGDDRDYARCAYRYGDPPDLRSSNIGFRVVVRSAPVSSTVRSEKSGL